MILDYSEYLEREKADGLLLGKTVNQNINNFYKSAEICPICKLKTYIVYNADSGVTYPEWLDGSYREYESVKTCPNCGWWEYKFNNTSDAMLDYTRLREEKFKTAILRKYNVDDKSIPITSLEKYIQKNPEKIYNIHHKKMEELTQSIFREHFNCDVELVGKTADGGIDLLFVKSDKPSVVQVKRRTKKDSVESASQIRELLGATLLADSRSCIFVTTADHFSKQAKQHASDAIDKKIVEEFELINYKRFIEMLGLYKSTKTEMWRKFLVVKRNLG
ncbi:conserved protein of unknown function [Petrocella atlantisensis]|uniref:Restriction endonuclease type IV Mrr domain-containing protein n=1 Tax=Petrocella atlantisensis TaxID=2173034 RepID=A0A3P7NZE6_9FIRM|nr:restriction endonuclease [Petrocella atlantisensis]VDN46700.1 conserved protein of unknown function [Petrocella atlantisensis]